MRDDDDEEPVDMGNLELYEGDVSIVVRADGDVEFLIACEEESGDDYLRCLKLVQFLEFALKDDRCREVFESSLRNTLN